MFVRKLNQKQLEKLADIASDLGLVSVASIILPGVLDKFNAAGVLLGAVATIIFWIVSLWFRR